MASRTFTVGYTHTPMPVVPVSWHFSVWDSGGTIVGTEQTFPTPPSSVVFATIPPGTGYTGKGGQRDVANAEVGTPFVSAPFNVDPDTTVVMLVSALTIGT